MRKVTLGKTGLTVSWLGFGGIPIQRLSEEDAIAVIRGTIDLGIDFIDTANGYSTSEERIGKAIKHYDRTKLVIATKTGAGDKETARAHLELSLKRLGADYIDIYQLHGVSSDEKWNKVMGPGGAYETLAWAKAEGLIRYISFSSHSLSIAQKGVESGLFATLQYPFNLIADEAATELLPRMDELGMALIAMKPMGGGLIPNPRLAIRYLMQFPQIVVDPGIQDLAEIRQLHAAVEEGEGIHPADLAEIETIRADLGMHFCHRCEYCQPCPENIPISTILSVRSNLRRFPLERAFGADMAKTINKALDCQACGECETRCPYHLLIREMLAKESRDYLGEKEQYDQNPSTYVAPWGGRKDGETAESGY